MHSKPKIRFLIANAENARWVERHEGHFVTLGEIEAPDHYHATHPRRMVMESASPTRHGADEVDVGDRRRREFAAVLTEVINDGAANELFQRLAIAAPPRLLAAIRPNLSTKARARLVGEIDKDLTKIPNHDLDEWLRSPGLA